MNAIAMLRDAQADSGRSLAVFVRDIVHGMLAIGHNSLAVLGLGGNWLIVAAAVHS